jgi:chromate reductase
MHIIGLCGSLRAASINMALLRAARSLAPAGVTLDIVEADAMAALPLMNQDLERPDGRPAPVEALRARVWSADALLIAAPEYNYGVASPLKNAIDWLSRQEAGHPSGRRTPLVGKTAALLGATPSRTGTVRAQMQVRQILYPLGIHLLAAPEIFIGDAAGKFTDGELTDAPTRDLIARQLTALADWTARLAAQA